MKKFLFIPALAVLVLSGCADGDRGETAAAPQSDTQMQQDTKTSAAADMQEGAVNTASAAQDTAEPVINPEVAPLDTYTSADDVVKDVDGLMNDLDNI